MTLNLPKFATLCLTDLPFDTNVKPPSSVSFQLAAETKGGKSSLVSLGDWIDASFINQQINTKELLHAHRTPPARPGQGGTGRLHAVFHSIHSNSQTQVDLNPLWVEAYYVQDGSLSVSLHCITLELASLLMADLCQFLSISELASTCDFEQDMLELKELMEQV